MVSAETLLSYLDRKTPVIFHTDSSLSCLKLQE